MSKIGKLPIELKDGVRVEINGSVVNVTGSKGNFTYTIPKEVLVKVENDKVIISQKDSSDINARAMWGLTRANIANLVKGVSEGFEKKLELSGVGYRAQVQGTNLSLSLGFSHPVVFPAPQGITFSVKDNNISVAGIDKVLVGQVAAQIRSAKPPEPYKGKGIKYAGERVRRKAGKSAKAVGGKS